MNTGKLLISELIGKVEYSFKGILNNTFGFFSWLLIHISKKKKEKRK